MVFALASVVNSNYLTYLSPVSLRLGPKGLYHCLGVSVLQSRPKAGVESRLTLLVLHHTLGACVALGYGDWAYANTARYDSLGGS
jgi:hypothetical protein